MGILGAFQDFAYPYDQLLKKESDGDDSWEDVFDAEILNEPI